MNRLETLGRYIHYLPTDIMEVNIKLADIAEDVGTYLVLFYMWQK